MRIDSFDVDMSQLARKSKHKKSDPHPDTRAKRHKKIRKSKPAEYNYTGYGDLRNGNKNTQKQSNSKNKKQNIRNNKHSQHKSKSKKPGMYSSYDKKAYGKASGKRH